MKTRNVISRLMSSLAAVVLVAVGASFTSCSDDDAVTLPAVVKLDTPANNTISDITVDGATFTWDRVSGAYTYTLQILLSETDTEPTAQVIINDPLYSATVTGLEGSTTYFARIQANDELSQGKDSPFSSFIEFTTEAPAIDMIQLSAPTATLVSKTSTTLSFSWTSVANAAEYYYVLSKGSEGVATVRTTDTSVSLSDLTPGTTYSFRVMAYPAADSEEYTFSDYSSTVVVKTVGPLAAPANLASDDASKTQTTLKFTWNAVTGAAGYAYALSTDGGTTYAADVQIAATEVELTGLTAGTSYTIKVKALAVYGGTDNSADYTDSEYSAAITTATISASATALSTPANITATSTASSLTITWDAVTNADRYSYKLNTAADGSGTDVKTGSVTTNSVTLSALDASTTYYFSVQALPASGSTTLLESAWSSWTSAATIAAGSSYNVSSADELLAAVANLNAGTGGTIYLAAGNYYLPAVYVDITSSITFEGPSSGVAYINGKGFRPTTGASSIDLVFRNIEYSGFEVVDSGTDNTPTGSNGDASSSTNESYFVDINGGTVNNLTIENCFIHNLFGGVVRANRAADCITGTATINNNRMYDIPGNNAGVIYYSQATATGTLVVTNNTVSGIGTYSRGAATRIMYLGGGSGFTATISNNTFYAIYGGTTNCIDAYATTSTGTYTVTNNIFVFTGGSERAPRLGSTNVSVDSNCVYPAWATNSASVKTNDLIADPGIGESTAVTGLTDIYNADFTPSNAAVKGLYGDPRWY